MLDESISHYSKHMQPSTQRVCTFQEAQMELETFPIDFRSFGVSYREEAFINSIDAFFLAESKIQKFVSFKVVT